MAWLPLDSLQSIVKFKKVDLHTYLAGLGISNDLPKGFKMYLHICLHFWFILLTITIIHPFVRSKMSLFTNSFLELGSQIEF